MAKEAKTNAMRALDRAKVPYQTYTYEHEDGVIDGVGVARKLGQNPAQVFKTLVTKGAGGSCFVFVCPVEKELDLKACARAVGEKSVAMIRVDEINGITGYIRGGCSPIGMKKQYVTMVDESCKNYTTIIFSAGRIGAQVEVAPGALIALTGAKTAPITI